MDKKRTEKCLILISNFATTPQYPGPTRNFDFACVLAERGWKVKLLNCRFNHYLRRYLHKPPKWQNGVRMAWIWSTPYRGNSIERELNVVVFSALSFWRGLFSRGDIVVTVTPPLETALCGWLLARMKRIPFILDLEDLWPDSIIAMGFRNQAVIKMMRFFEHFLYRHADHIQVVAAEMREYLLKQNVPEAKIDLIPLGANLPRCNRDRATIRAQYGWTDQEIVAVYMGAHGPANSLETLIRAAAKLDDSTIRIVLFGDGSDKPRLREIASELGIGSHLVLADPVPPEVVPDILQAADIGIASLKNTDTFKTVRPNKLYEYMAASLPIVCCIDGEARRFVTGLDSGIYVPPEDSGELATGLRRLAANPELRRRLGRNGREFVTREGDRRVLAVLMDQVLKKVIDGVK
ncbi:MAG TPA: glycosyltransferase family 4 protein [Bacillota bacterium]